VIAAPALRAQASAGIRIRRLANEIEYSQQVLYSHFENREAIIAAVAVVGFREISVVLREAASGATETFWATLHGLAQLERTQRTLDSRPAHSHSRPPRLQARPGLQ
jgi:AcrR family transcriptional regulator